MIIREPARGIEVLRQADVLVAGAGVAGCAAAVAAARAGAKTVLLERNGTLGGVATAGLMANIGNLFMDGEGRMVIGGVGREVIDRLVRAGGASSAWASREVPGCVVDSEKLKVVLIEMQQEAGVEVLTHTLAARPIVDGATVKGAFIESKLGRQAVLGRVVVDATGEADLAWQAGCPMRWVEGSASLEFKMARVNLDALYQHFRRHPETFPVGRDMVKGFAEFERNWVERGIFFFPHGGGFEWDIFQRAIAEGRLKKNWGILWNLDAAGLYGLRDADSVIVNSNFWKVTSLSAPDVSRAELEAHKAAYYVADFFRRSVPGFERAYIAQIATDLGIRHSRGIAGVETQNAEDLPEGQSLYLDNAIGRRPATTSFPQTGQFFTPHSWDIPYGVIVPQGAENLLVASGKSASTEPMRLLRSMATCMVLGQAAGAAAALSAKEGTPPHELDVRKVQRVLLEQGGDLGPSDRPAALGLTL